MKKKFKKTILGTFFVGLVLVMPFISKGGIEEVKAEEKNCTKHSNYYFFSLVADVSAYDNKSFPFTRTHISYFLDDIPEGTVLDSVEYKWLNLKNGEGGWTIQKFWEKNLELTKNGLGEQGNLIKNDNEWYFSHAKAWFNDETGEESEGYIDPSKYKLEDVVKNSYYYQTENGPIVLKIDEATGEALPGSVKRTIGTDWPDFAESVRAQYSGGVHPTERYVWLPALLKATFDVCDSETVIPEDSHKVTLKYVDDSTNEEIKEQLNIGRYKKGEDYSAICLEKIDDYKLVSTKDLKGTMADEDVTLYCRYSKDGAEPTYKVTVNYLDKNTKKPIKDAYTYPTSYKNGQKYTASCLDSIGNNYILDSYSGSLTGTINNKNVEINCLYTTEPTQTSDIPIYIVWAVGGAALAYSIYYFRKYYKQQNNV